MKYFSAATAAALLLCSTSAHATSDKGVYAQGSLYGVHMNEQDFVVTGVGRTDLDYSFGFGVGGAVGYDFGNQFRAEAELVYRTNDVDEPGVSGEFDSLAGMVNGYYDIEQVNLPVTPYIGGGIGFAELSPDDADDTVYAYQIMTGVAYPFNSQVEGVLGYRFFATQDAEYNVSGFNVGTSYDTHNVELGVRYRF